MPELSALVTLILLLILVFLVLAAVVAYELRGLPKRRMEAFVVGKKHYPSAFDPVATVSLYGDDAFFAGARETPEQFIVLLQVGGNDHVMRVEPEMFRAVQVGSTVQVIGTVGRLSGALVPETIILPMPDPPTDPDKIM